MASTKKPTGITITRDNALKFIITWKIADKDYNDGHQIRYRTWTSEKKHSGWTTSTVSAAKKTITLSASNWYPTTSKKLFYFEVEIRGKRKKSGSTTYDWSAWANKKWKLTVPKKPSLSATLTDPNVTDFEWDVTVDKKGAAPFANVEYQTILKKECTEKDGSKIKWSSATKGSGSASSHTEITEDTTILAENSYTRWLRARARGARGYSDWKYDKHVYARPYAAKIEEASANEQGANTLLKVKWTADTNAAHPIDLTTTEYYIGTPGAGMTFPPGQSGTEGSQSRDTSGDDAASYIINDTVQTDQCLFVRVCTQHDSNINYSDWYLVSAGPLAAPSGLNVNYNSSTARVAVTDLDNESDVPDAKMMLVYRGASDPINIAVINPGDPLPSAIQCPAGNDSPAFGVFAYVGTETAKEMDGITVYEVDAGMISDTVWLGGNVPAVPANFSAKASGREGEVILTWDWSWADSNQAEISWSKNEFAWESTDEPTTYIIDSIRAAQWRVSGLDAGSTWYFRVRLIQETDNSTVYGPYSGTKAVSLSTAPNTPVLSLSAGVIPEGGTLTATWGYTTTDGTQQAYAEICAATVDDTEDPPVTYGAEVGHALTSQNATIDTTGWTAGETYYLCVRVTSSSGVVSDWSDPVPVTVAEPVEISIAQTSLVTLTIDGVEDLYLTALPLTATITGAGVGGTTTLIIERADDYRMIRPDDSVTDGYKGETIALFTQNGEDQITIGADDLIGRFDDGAPYRLIATVEDGLGQADTRELEFSIRWSHQAGIPAASVTTEGDVAVITVAAPEDALAGDTVDIYRLSTDKPQLIVEGGAFGTAYVDPFPALGENAGYRCVAITANGDYITEDDQPAWDDVIGELFSNRDGIINFNGETIRVQFNVSLSSSWKKDFKETKYLGGTVRGDWNPAISRTASIGVTIPTDDTESIMAMRRLADWNGICHIRTQDGSSYPCDIQVSGNSSYNEAGKVETYSLSVTRVQSDTLDGIPYSEWVVE